MSTTRVDLRYMQYNDDTDISTPLEDTIARRQDPLYALHTRYCRAFQLKHPAMLNTSHGSQFIGKDDYVYIDEANGLVHAAPAVVFEGIYDRCEFDNVNDTQSVYSAHLEGKVSELAAFMRKVAWVTRGGHVDGINIHSALDGVTLVADIVFANVEIE